MATSTPKYQLSSEIYGHSGDVRAVAVVTTSDTLVNTLVTASRDGTACVWQCDGKDYILRKVIKSHTGYVSSLCIVPVSVAKGRMKALVASGAQDNTILVHSMEEESAEEPVERYAGHKGLITCLLYQCDQLISGSWDSTIRIWKSGSKSEVIEAHKPAVWAITGLFEFDGTNRILSGGADRAVRMWELDTKVCVQEYHGHADVVRDVKASSHEEFFSASNDCVIRKWNIHSGQCLREICGHEAFVYCLALLPSGRDGFVSCGEDGTVRVWKDGECSQIIHIPATSVWSVACSASGDIMTGSSDGVARVFTTDDKKVATAQEISVYNAKVTEHRSASKKSDIDVSKLPGKDALYNPGRSSGETLMINNDGIPEVYQWDTDIREWIKIGNAIGKAPDKSQVYNGKEYDFVFDIELDDGPPPMRTLKLPYNRTTDPYVAAEDFLSTNNLPAYYLDQVAEFIIQNANVSTGPINEMGADPFTGGSRYVPNVSGSAHAGTGSSDPFTGGNRYQPTQSDPSWSSSSVGGGADPFTGGGSYCPAEFDKQFQEKSFTVKFQGSGSSKGSFFPMPEFKFFESPGDYGDKVMAKVREFNVTMDQTHNLSDAQLTTLQGFCKALNESTSSISKESLSTIEKLLNWPAQNMFPGLDFLRLTLLNKVCHKHFISTIDSGRLFVDRLLNLVQGPENSNEKNLLLVLRCLANIFSQPLGVEVMDSHRVKVFADLVKLYASCTSRPSQIALSTVVLNYSHHYCKKEKLDGYMECTEHICKIFESSFDDEAKFRALISVGSLAMVSKDAVKLSAQPKNVVTIVQNVKSLSDVAKVKECANAVLDLLK